MCHGGTLRTGKSSCSIEVTGDHTVADSWSALQNVQLSLKNLASRLSLPASTQSIKQRKWPTRSVSQSVMVLRETLPTRLAHGGMKGARSFSLPSSYLELKTRSWHQVIAMDRLGGYLMMTLSELSRSCWRNSSCLSDAGNKNGSAIVGPFFIVE